MTPEQFTYWLQGFFEISGTQQIDERQAKIIQDHLRLVFNKLTPNRDPFLPAPLGEGTQYPWDQQPVCGSIQEHEDTVKYLRTAVSG